MDPVEDSRAELNLPGSTLAHFRRVLRDRLGSVEATRVLHDTGFAAGAAEFDHFADSVGDAPASLGADAFWSRLDEHLQSRGWGSVRHERVHPGLAVLHARGWGESDSEGGDSETTCAFGAGMLAHLLGRTAKGPIAVLEVSCRSRGDEDCTFLFGSEDAVQAAYDAMDEHGDVDAALGSI